MTTDYGDIMTRKMSLEERLEAQRLRFLNDHVYNVRPVEHLGMKIQIGETLYGSTIVFSEDKYRHIGYYDGQKLYQKIPRHERLSQTIEGNTIHKD